MKDISYQWTKNPPKDYYIVRSRIYDSDLSLDIPFTDHFDSMSDHLIVYWKNEIIGGARLTVSTTMKVPLEYETCLLERVFTKEHLKEFGYGEVTRLFLLKKYRDRKIIRHIYSSMETKRKDYGVHYLFSFQPKGRARLTAMVCKHLGFRTSIIRVDKICKKSLYTALGHLYLVAITNDRDKKWQHHNSNHMHHL